MTVAKSPLCNYWPSTEFRQDPSWVEVVLFYFFNIFKVLTYLPLFASKVHLDNLSICIYYAFKFFSCSITRIIINIILSLER